MQAVTAVESDIPAWLRLTAQAEALFGSMLADPEYLGVVRRKIGRGLAFCVRAGGGPPGSELNGGLLFSAHPPRYRIGWLVVSANARRLGLGRLLVSHALRLCVPPCQVMVTTFAPGVAGGEAAVAFYRALGFQPGEIAPDPGDPQGLPTRQEYILSID